MMIRCLKGDECRKIVGVMSEFVGLLEKCCDIVVSLLNAFLSGNCRNNVGFS